MSDDYDMPRDRIDALNTPRRRRQTGRCYDRTCGAPDCPLCYPCGGEETTEEGEG
jgi:hypothetical protein